MFLPLELTLRPSRIYALVLVMAHSLAMLGVWMAAVPGLARLALSLAIAVNLIWVVRKISSGPSGVRVSQSGLIEVLQGEWQTAVIHRQPVVLAWFVSLPLLSRRNKALRLMIFPDSLEKENFRKLRVWLKWGNLA